MTDNNGDVGNKSNDNLRHRGENKTEDEGKSKCQINTEYFQALEKWLNDSRSHKCCSFMAGFPYAMFAQQMYAFFPPLAVNGNNFSPFVPPINQGLGIFTFNNNQQHQQRSVVRNRSRQIQEQEGVEYKIPPLWKRFVAELLDFILLFVMKMALTLVAVDFFDFVDFEKFNNLQQNKMDYKIAVEITSEIFFLEIIHRLIVCIYETVFLRRGLQNQIGGATPGKTFVGIRVILCNNIQPVQNQPNVVRISPATNLGLGWSIVRAFLKNFLLALLFPIGFPFFFNKFNRTTYDILCHSIVVEDRNE